MHNQRARSEQGFALIEVVVSAAVLIIVVLGVLAAVDSVSRTAAANQGKTVAATIAEKDLERLRALRTSDLDRLDEIETETRIVPVGGRDWEVTSKAQWVTDSTGEDISCALTADKGSYLRITSSVVPASAPAGTEPLVMSSIVAPQPGKGTLTALVRNADGNPVTNLPVEAVGPTPATKMTNDAGCAVFDESEAGSYKLRLNSSGWVDPNGHQLVEKPGTVSAGNLTTVEFIYDRAGSFPVTVVTRRPGAASDVEDRSTGVIAAHTGITGTGYRAMTATSSSTFTFTSMFPFQTPYEVYSGTCTGHNPAKAIPDANYFSAHPLAAAQVEPGQVGEMRYVIEPAVDVTVKYGGNLASGARIYAYDKTADCAAVEIYMGQTGSDGKLPADNADVGPGLPFGTYDVCAEVTTGSWWNRKTYYKTLTGVANTDPAGTSRSIDLTSSSSTGGCP